MKAELVWDAQAALAEGPVWDGSDHVLWWVEILGGEVHRYDPGDGSDCHWTVGQMVGTAVLRASGGLLLAAEHGFMAFDPGDGSLQPICDPEPDRPQNRMNDGKCDPAGRFWAGSMSQQERPEAGALYSLDIDQRCRKHLHGVTVSNGIAWTQDQRTMYFVDSPTRRIDAFDFDVAEGMLANRRTVFAFPAGVGNPDGMAIDVHDNLWVAMWGGWSVCAVDPRGGEMLSKIDFPCSNVTSCAFGGPDLQDLYITTARDRMERSGVSDQPQAGGLFCVQPGVRGRPAEQYRG